VVVSAFNFAMRLAVGSGEWLLRTLWTPISRQVKYTSVTNTPESRSAQKANHDIGTSSTIEPPRRDTTVVRDIEASLLNPGWTLLPHFLNTSPLLTTTEAAGVLCLASSPAASALILTALSFAASSASSFCSVAKLKSSSWVNVYVNMFPADVVSSNHASQPSR
jgi:hypothetical protein